VGILGLYKYANVIYNYFSYNFTLQSKEIAEVNTLFVKHIPLLGNTNYRANIIFETF
jgi:hypothetical protein